MNLQLILLFIIVGVIGYEYYVCSKIGQCAIQFRGAIRYLQGNLRYVRDYLFVRTYLFVNQATAEKQERELARIERKRRHNI